MLHLGRWSPSGMRLEQRIREYEQMSLLWETEEQRLQTAQREQIVPQEPVRRKGGRPRKPAVVPQVLKEPPAQIEKKEPTSLFSPDPLPLPPSRWLVSSCALDWLHSAVEGQNSRHRLFDSLPRRLALFLPLAQASPLSRVSVAALGSGSLSHPQQFFSPRLWFAQTTFQGDRSM